MVMSSGVFVFVIEWTVWLMVCLDVAPGAFLLTIRSLPVGRCSTIDPSFHMSIGKVCCPPGSLGLPGLMMGIFRLTFHIRALQVVDLLIEIAYVKIVSPVFAFVLINNLCAASVGKYVRKIHSVDCCLLQVYKHIASSSREQHRCFRTNFIAYPSASLPNDEVSLSMTFSCDNSNQNS